MGEAERKRLAAVERTNLLDTPAEGRFDRITRIARRLLRVPISVVSVVGAERRFFKTDSDQIMVWDTPSEGSLCSHAIESAEEMLVVPDTSALDRYAASPLVAGAPHVRFYAGKPFHHEGQRVGVLCVMALVDELTRTWNRRGLKEVFAREAAHARRDGSCLCVAMAHLDHFKRVNDSHGHEAGDLVLRAVAERLRLSVRPYDVVGRMGGEEFLLIFPRSSLDMAVKVAERVRRTVLNLPIPTPGGQLVVTLSLGVAAAGPTSIPPLAELVRAADEALYRAKRGGRNRVEVAERSVVRPATKPSRGTRVRMGHRVKVYEEGG